MRAPPGGGGEDGRAPVATPAGPPVGEEGEEARGEDIVGVVWCGVWD